MKFVVQIMEQRNGTWNWRVNIATPHGEHVDYGVGSTEADAKQLAEKAARHYLAEMKAKEALKDFVYDLEVE